jgi:hypothetical protein
MLTNNSRSRIDLNREKIFHYKNEYLRIIFGLEVEQSK